MSGLYDVMKQITKEYDDNKSNTSLCFGTVRSAKPLLVELDSKIQLDQSYFVVAQHLTKYTIECEIETDEINGFFVQHEGLHDVQTQDGEQIGKITLDNQLKAGDRVLIIRMDGGQHFAIIDRLINTDDSKK